MARRPQRFTIYDMMEQKGVFEANPANPDSRDVEGKSLYTGPVKYPMMFYHPEGATKITVQAEIIVTPMGPKSVGEQREIIWQLAENPEQEAKLRADGWHDSPVKAAAVAKGEPVPESKDETIGRLQVEMAKLQERLNREQAAVLAAQSARTVGATTRGNGASSAQASAAGPASSKSEN